MFNNVNKLLEKGCSTEQGHKVCRSRGGESCAFDGAMIVLQPIADAAHIVHGPIACCGNSWEGRGTLSSKGDLHKMGFTTDMNEMDIVYGSEEKLYKAVMHTYETVRPKAIFVYATCVSGLTGEDIEAVCRKAESELPVRVIPVNAPGFVGPKNLGNRIAGEVLLDHVIGTGTPHFTTSRDINLIGEYNIAGDLWLVEPVLNKAGIRVLSRITGDSTFQEITYAHRAKLNVVVCSRALINVAKEMERKYGIPYIEVSFFGKSEMSKALKAIKDALNRLDGSKGFNGLNSLTEKVITTEEKRIEERLKAYEHLKGKKAVLYTGGVKSWSFISALLDLGIEIVGVGTKKSSLEDEEKMKEILGEDAPLIEDVTPKNLLRILKDKNADILVAGGRNQYLAVKEGYPFVDVNQERHTAYAGYEGLINLAERISNSINFYDRQSAVSIQPSAYRRKNNLKGTVPDLRTERSGVVESGLSPALQAITINPLKHSQAIGAAMAFQGIHKSLPIIHGAQGCTFLGKVLLTNHFRDPIALASTKLFTEQVVMGSDEKLVEIAKGFIEKNRPEVIGILSSGLSEAKGDDLEGAVKQLQTEYPDCRVLPVATPDYAGGLETGFAKATEALLHLVRPVRSGLIWNQVNILAGPHLTPADYTELREIIEAFGLKPIILPDLSALDGSRQGMSPLAVGGTSVDDIQSMSASVFTLAIGQSMEASASILKERFGIGYKIFEGISGLKDSDMLMETLLMLGAGTMPEKFARQRRILVDNMRDAHFYFGGKKICLALEPDLSLQTSRWLAEMGADVGLAIVPHYSPAVDKVCAEEAVIGDLHSVRGGSDLLITSSHGEETAKRLDIPLYQLGFPVYKQIGAVHRLTIGYRGALTLINEAANLMMQKH